MGLGQLFTRTPHPPPENRLAGSNFEMIIDGQIFEVMEAYSGALAIPGFWRASTLISDLIGQLPWSLYRFNAKTGINDLLPQPLILDSPNPYESRLNTFSSMAMDLLFHGSGIAVIGDRDQDGIPLSLVPVGAKGVQVRQTDQGPEYDINSKTYHHTDVLHVKGPSAPGELRGWGVLEAHITSIDLALALQKQATSVGVHGVPSGMLKISDPNATKGDMLEVKDAWLKAQEQRTIAVANASTEFVPLAWNPEQLQLLDSRKFSLHETALIFGLPMSFLGAEQSSRTYTSTEHESLNLIKFSLAGHLARFEQAISKLFPRGDVVKADLDSILRADTLLRYQSHQIGLSAGFLSVDEVRAKEDLPPAPDLPEVEKPASQGVEDDV